MKFAIFNLNMWLLPLFLSRDNRMRVKRLIAFIKKENPDIITLQEVWLNRQLLFLKRQLPGYFFTYENGFFSNRSGLVIISKEKPSSYSFFVFKKQTLLHKLINRGIQIAKFEGFSLCNAHLHTIPGVQDSKIAMEELEFVKTKIKGEKICFLCGDLNIEKKEFEEVNKGIFKYAEDTGITFSEDSPYVHKWWDPNIVTDKKIDYILVKTSGKFKFKSKIIKEGLSDHYGIYSEIMI